MSLLSKAIDDGFVDVIIELNIDFELLGDWIKHLFLNMFNKIATELRKVEYPRKTRQRVPAELRNFTYIPIQQVRQPISLS